MKLTKLKDLKIIHTTSNKALINEGISKLITTPLDSFELQLRDGFWIENQLPPYNWDELNYMNLLQANKKTVLLENQIIISSGGLAEIVKFFSAESHVRFFKWEFQNSASPPKPPGPFGHKSRFGIDKNEVKIVKIEFFYCLVENADMIKKI